MNDPMPNKPLEIETDIEVPFYDVDMMNVVWHGNYARYLEVARCKLLDSIDYGYAQMRESGYAWPVVDMRLRYVQPCRFQQVIRVKATLAEWEYRLRIKYLITDAESGKKLTKARTDQVAVEIKTGEMCIVSPPILLSKLGVSG
ncbi:MAG: acyl-CoA thioesterase [Pseudomonadales bacterium]